MSDKLGTAEEASYVNVQCSRVWRMSMGSLSRNEISSDEQTEIAAMIEMVKREKESGSISLRKFKARMKRIELMLPPKYSRQGLIRKRPPIFCRLP